MKSKLATVKEGNVPSSSQNMNSQFFAATHGEQFLKIWDQMKTTSFRCPFSLTSANKYQKQQQQQQDQQQQQQVCVPGAQRVGREIGDEGT
jgi:CRISPR/Cas system-associated endonuclease/helicase Cas3